MVPILSYGQSTQKYTDANATYSTTLRNKCAPRLTPTQWK